MYTLICVECGKEFENSHKTRKYCSVECSRKHTNSNLKNKYIDLTGKKFNRLTVLCLGERNSNNQIQWKCKCDCGNIVLATTTYLKTGHTKSCGCLAREKASNNLKKQNFVKAREQYRKDNFLVEGTSLALINSKKLRKNNSTGVNGVYWHKQAKRYVARITISGKDIYLGCFSKLEEARKARLQAEEKYFKPILDKYREEH